VKKGGNYTPFILFKTNVEKKMTKFLPLHINEKGKLHIKDQLERIGLSGEFDLDEFCADIEQTDQFKKMRGDNPESTCKLSLIRVDFEDVTFS